MKLLTLGEMADLLVAIHDRHPDECAVTPSELSAAPAKAPAADDAKPMPKVRGPRKPKRTVER